MPEPFTPTPTPIKTIFNPTPEKQEDTADPYITKQVNPSSAFIGDVLVFTLTVGDHGSVAAQSVIVKDTLPDYLDILSATSTRGTVSIEGQTVVVVIGTVRPTDMIYIQIRARISDRNPPSIGYNTAHLSTTSSGDDPNNNTDTAIFTISRPGANETPIPIPPELPRTGTPADEHGSQLPMTLIALLLLALGLLLRRGGRRRVSRS